MFCGKFQFTSLAPGASGPSISNHPVNGEALLGSAGSGLPKLSMPLSAPPWCKNASSVKMVAWAVVAASRATARIILFTAVSPLMV